MSGQQPEDETTTPQREDEGAGQNGSRNDGSDHASGSDDSSAAALEASSPGDIGDDRLPEDLQPTEDNPLARHPGQTGDDNDKIGADTEGGDSESPSSNMAYGSEDSNAPADPDGSETDAEGS